MNSVTNTDPSLSDPRSNFLGSTQPLGVAVLGTGFGEKVHIPGFQAHPQTNVVAVYHRDFGKAQTVADRHGIPQAHSSLKDILALPDVEAVSVATPPFLHFEMAKAVLKADKHLFLEKPITLTLDEASALDQLANDRGLTVTVDFEYRVVPPWQYLKQRLAQGDVGQPYLITIDWLMSSRANPHRPWNWYARRDQGGGALGSLGSHSFDYIAWLFGDVFGPVRRLHAHLSTAIKQRPDPLSHNQLRSVDSDDSCFLTLELSDGTPIQLAISAVAANGRGHWVEIYGDRGNLVLGSSSQSDYIYGFKLWHGTPGQALTEQPIPPALDFDTLPSDGRLAAFRRMIDIFTQGIQSHTSPAPGLREGIYSQLLMELTHRSHQTGHWVEVPPLTTILT